MNGGIYINFDGQKWIPEVRHERILAKRDKLIRDLLKVVGDDRGVPRLLQYYELADGLGVQLYEKE